MENINFVPSKDYILLEVKEIEEKTASGLIKSKELIAEEANAEKDSFLKVKAVCVGSKYNVNDNILLAPGRHQMINLGDKKYWIVNEIYVLGTKK